MRPPRFGKSDTPEDVCGDVELSAGLVEECRVEAFVFCISLSRELGRALGCGSFPLILALSLARGRVVRPCTQRSNIIGFGYRWLNRDFRHPVTCSDFSRDPGKAGKDC